jgi:hypothetical protein
MREHPLDDPLLTAVRTARPAIDAAVLEPTSEEAVNMLEQLLSGEGAARPQASRRAPLPRRRIFRPRIGALATAAVAAVVVVVIVLSGISGSPSLVDRAYAAVNVSDQVLHEVDVQTEPNLRNYSQRLEGWLLPANGQARLIIIYGYKSTPFVTEWIITAKRHAFTRACLAYCHPQRFMNSSGGWSNEGVPRPGFGGSPTTIPGTYAQWFRSAYRERAVVADGNTTFDGRTVAHFQSMAELLDNLVFWRPGTPIPASIRDNGNSFIRRSIGVINWYVDPATAEPVGYTVTTCSSDQLRSCHAPDTTVRILTFQRLNPTPQNLELLIGPGAPAGAR